MKLETVLHQVIYPMLQNVLNRSTTNNNLSTSKYQPVQSQCSKGTINKHMYILCKKIGQGVEGRLGQVSHELCPSASTDFPSTDRPD